MVDNSERIYRFLRNQMTSDERQYFLNDLEADMELRKEAQFTALMIKEIREREAKEQIIEEAEVIEDVIETKEKEKKLKVIKMARWSLSIAAMFLLIFGATTLWNRQSDTDALFSNHYTTYNTAMLRGGDDTAIVTELSKMFNDIGTAEDVTPIITRLQTIYDNLQSGKDDYADYRDYKNDIAWYLALAYIKTDNIDRAKEILKPLADRGNSEAIRLIKEIEKE